MSKRLDPGLEDPSGSLPTVTIFICSSGDMIPERDAALRGIEALQEECADQARLRLYRWEDNVTRFDPARTYQGNIPLPADSDIFLGFLFSRIGSALNREEYERDLRQAIERRARASGVIATKDRDVSSLPKELLEEEELPPTGTQFEVANALAAAREPGADGAPRGRPRIWLAFNAATPPYVDAKDAAVRQTGFDNHEKARAYIETLNREHTPVNFTYGEGQRRAHQEQPGGLMEFERALGDFLRSTLETEFGIALRWHGDAYVGLTPYEPEHARIFFGRQRMVGIAFGMLEEAVRLRRPPMLLLAGRSGAGKSSFARAGLVGNLHLYPQHVRRAGAGGVEYLRIGHWRTLVFKPTELLDNPIRRVVERLARALGTDAFGGHDAVLRLGDDLTAAVSAAGDPSLGLRDFDGVAAAVHRALTRQPGRGPAGLFLLLDQMEELFRLPGLSSAERRLPIALLCALVEAPEGNVRVVLALADAWRGELQPMGLMPYLAEVKLFELPSPDPHELREIVETPARRKGLRFEPGRDGRSLAEVICADLRRLSLHEEAPLALLQTALRRLEERATSDGVLTFDAYKDMGGLQGAIQKHAAEALESVPAGQREVVLDRLFFRLLGPDPRGRIVGRSAPQRELEEEPAVWALTQALLAPDRRLLVGAGERDDAAVIRLAHEVLLEHWPNLKAFIKRERENLVLLTNAREQAAQWLKEGRRTTLLGQDEPVLRLLRTLIDRAAVPDGDPVRDYVQGSFAWFVLARGAAEALETRRFDDALSLLEEGADLSYRGSANRSLMHLACGVGAERVVLYLVDRDPALARATDAEGSTALHLAALLGSYRNIVALLLDRDPALSRVRQSGGMTALHSAAFSNRAGRRAEVAALLLDRDPGLAGVAAAGGVTALHAAAKEGHQDVAVLLLQRAPALLRATDSDGRTALHWAAFWDHAEFAALLLDRDPTLTSATDGDRRTALHVAAFAGRTKAAALLLDRGPTLASAADAGGATALHLAAQDGHQDVVALLLDHDPALLRMPDGRGQTALHLAAGFGHMGAAALLLDRAPTLAGVADAKGATALHLAAQHGNDDVVTLLLDRDPALLRATDSYGQTALHAAAFEGHTGVLALLLDRDQALVRTKDSHGRTALQLAAQGSHQDAAALLLDRDRALPGAT